MSILQMCIANCKFCNFTEFPAFRILHHKYRSVQTKIEETFRYGGEQLLLQGGHHPDLGLKYYVDLFRELKRLYPKLKLHSLGPPEIAHITKLEGSNILKFCALMDADSIHFQVQARKFSTTEYAD